MTLWRDPLNAMRCPDAGVTATEARLPAVPVYVMNCDGAPYCEGEGCRALVGLPSTA